MGYICAGDVHKYLMRVVFEAYRLKYTSIRHVCHLHYLHILFSAYSYLSHLQI
jgi:hypothetical protein